MIRKIILDGGVLERHAARYCAYLDEQQYSSNTQQSYERCILHFGHWITRQRIQVQLIDEQIVEEFIKRHLICCKCTFPVRRRPYENKAALRHLLSVLRSGGVIGNPKGANNVMDREVRCFDSYMDRICGLAQNTRYQQRQIVGRFLRALFKTGPIATTRITPTAMRRFVLGESRKYSPGTIHVIRGSVTCYLRFRALGGDHVQHLLSSLPSVANWRLATVPEVLSDREIDQLLQSFKRLKDSPKRAYAMARCLVDLGLRASEVAHLQLDDIDWNAGTIRLAANKSRRSDLLPLTADTGAAIADYIRSERPRSANRAVFSRHVAPYDKPVLPGVVRRVIREAYQRCGWSRTRVHILRHTVASRLLQAGTPLKEIADVLRHRSLDTSIIYTKVDLKRLSAVALPWPGRSI